MPGDPVFLDSNGWLAILNASDSLHKQADLEWRKIGEQRRPIVLTDWVVAETGNCLARCRGRNLFAGAVERLATGPLGQLVFVEDDLLRRALTLYSSRPDKTWSLTDCASFVLMKEKGIRDAFTTDRHFFQAGFKCLLSMA